METLVELYQLNIAGRLVLCFESLRVCLEMPANPLLSTVLESPRVKDGNACAAACHEEEGFHLESVEWFHGYCCQGNTV